MAVKIEKAKNEDGFCCSCLDNKQHKRLYRVEISTYGSTFEFHLCEHCMKDFDNGLHNPSERSEKHTKPAKQEDDEWPDEDEWPD